ncbi:hypothetical protein GCM10010404_79190 [Nonomuraea africana]|uniref:HTH psq-type domain-containing protein n=1 Tax=Nonomuraea africana TaxID=46171 RepID=A0ABR9KJ19_9ACTN|nr:hypothetical protein [Nonomuraea africana]MBE1562014.1 hypothetical protein [Nonomuraea africana]
MRQFARDLSRTSTPSPQTVCAAEIGIARSQGNHLLPVLAEPGQTHPLRPASQYQYTDLRDPGTARAALAEALRRIDAAGGLGWPDDRPPFLGCAPSTSTGTGSSSAGAPAALAQPLYDEREKQQIADMFGVPRSTMYGHLDKTKTMPRQPKKGAATKP